MVFVIAISLDLNVEMGNQENKTNTIHLHDKTSKKFIIIRSNITCSITRLKIYVRYFLFICVYWCFIFYCEARKNYKNICSIILFFFFFGFLDFYFAFFLCGKYLLVDKHLEGCGIKFLKFFNTVKWESMSLSNVNTSCRIKTAGQWNVVFRQNLLSGTYKFLDNAENNKFILF